MGPSNQGLRDSNKIRSSQVTGEMILDTIKLIGRSVPSPQVPLSIPSIVGATVDMSISDTIESTTDEIGTHLETPQTDTT